MENPYATPVTAEIAVDAEVVSQRQYGGIGRLLFLGSLIAISVAQRITTTAIVETVGDPTVALVGVFAFLFLYGVAVYYRFKNIGMNPWWCLLTFVPLLNLLVFVRCLVVPEGYADTKKLDTAGRVFTILVFLLFLALVAVALIAASGISVR